MEFVEVVLVEATRRGGRALGAARGRTVTAVQRDAHLMLDRAGGLDVVPELHRRLHGVLAGRPDARRVEPVPGDVEQTYRALLDRL